MKTYMKNFLQHAYAKVGCMVLCGHCVSKTIIISVATLFLVPVSAAQDKSFIVAEIVINYRTNSFYFLIKVFTHECMPETY